MVVQQVVLVRVAVSAQTTVVSVRMVQEVRAVSGTDVAKGKLVIKKVYVLQGYLLK